MLRTTFRNPSALHWSVRLTPSIDHERGKMWMRPTEHVLPMKAFVESHVWPSYFLELYGSHQGYPSVTSIPTECRWLSTSRTVRHNPIYPCFPPIFRVCDCLIPNFKTQSESVCTCVMPTARLLGFPLRTAFSREFNHSFSTGKNTWNSRRSYFQKFLLPKISLISLLSSPITICLGEDSVAS